MVRKNSLKTSPFLLFVVLVAASGALLLTIFAHSHGQTIWSNLRETSPSPKKSREFVPVNFKGGMLRPADSDDDYSFLVERSALLRTYLLWKEAWQEFLERLGRGQDEETAVSPTQALLPSFQCPPTERYGRDGDGGKTICAVDALTEGCVIYSIGSNYDVSFELSMLQTTHCKVFVFDCTVAGIPTEKIPPEHRDRIVFRPWCLGGPETSVSSISSMHDREAQGELKTLKMIMKDFQHDTVDIFKVDIEGSEWDALEAMFRDSVFPTQLLMEIHGKTKRSTGETYSDIISSTFARLDSVGYAMYHYEANYYWVFHTELSLVRVDRPSIILSPKIRKYADVLPPPKFAEDVLYLYLSEENKLLVPSDFRPAAEDPIVTWLPGRVGPAIEKWTAFVQKENEMSEAEYAKYHIGQERHSISIAFVGIVPPFLCPDMEPITMGLDDFGPYACGVRSWPRLFKVTAVLEESPKKEQFISGLSKFLGDCGVNSVSRIVSPLDDDEWLQDSPELVIMRYMDISTLQVAVDNLVQKPPNQLPVQLTIQFSIDTKEEGRIVYRLFSLLLDMSYIPFSVQRHPSPRINILEVSFLRLAFSSETAQSALIDRENPIEQRVA